MQNARQKGFTLIELSIVLVIIGLIVGGMLVGQELIHASQLRAVISEVEKFNTAGNTFNSKYDCLPGDCTNVAIQLADHIQGGYPYDKNGHIIWNGNGNGTIDGIGTWGCGGSTVPGYNNNGYANIMEVWGFWHHLSISGMIPSAGTAPGGSVCGPTSCTDSLVGTNLPASILGGATGYAVGTASPTGGGELYTAATGNVFIIGTQDTATNNTNSDVCQYSGPWLPAFTAIDAQNIDKKIDDGQPGTGSVTSFQPTGHFNPSCVRGSAYNITSSGLQCTLVFQVQFQ